MNDSGRLGYSAPKGDGTSYATAHVASATVLRLAHHWPDVQCLYGNIWQRVEAFRHCLQRSAHAGPNWDSTRYGTGILHIPDLLQEALPDPARLTKVHDLAADDLF